MEANKLGDYNQRTRGRLRESKSVEHLTCAKPAVVLDSLLRHIRENRISSTESDHCSDAEKDPFSNHRMSPPKPKAEQNDGCPPECNPGNTDPKRTIPGWLCMFRNGGGIVQYRVVLRFSMAAKNKKFIFLPLAS